MPRANHLVMLVEELSMEAFLQELMPRVLPSTVGFEVHPFQGKTDLMNKLEARLRAYANWLPSDWRIFTIVDKDSDDCRALKARMEEAANRSGLLTRSRARAAGQWQLANRIVVEELEAWYFGDWEGVRAAYPRVSPDVPRQRGLRNPDSIAGGTCEAFERVMRRYGYFETGLAKIEAARTVGKHLKPARNSSQSFRAFHSALTELLIEAG